MANIDYKESNYRFTQPIRYYKSNDPVYYEVDNIPLKQLEENVLWMKDQLVPQEIPEFISTRANFNELQPYVEGTDNVVKVSPGRFTARINDAYNISPLQIIESLIPANALQLNAWQVPTFYNTVLTPILDQFKQSISSPMYLNGLVERLFTSPIANPDSKTEEGVTLPEITRIAANLWGSQTTDQTQILRQYDEVGLGFGDMPYAETNFIKKWRGIARTAIVDVAEELSIEIPAFTDADYTFTLENGVTQQTIPATQRIDLVFIYAKPVDASSTTVAKFVGGSPTTLLKPQLGIVRGAGLGINKGNNSKYIDPTDSEGTLKILANPGDETANNIGFSGLNVKGSFPSPDDLMNLAPTLLEGLEANDPILIGQTILPVAYVVVRKNAEINENEVPIIPRTDLIDIRPFFRTTELTYNERAGLAAATPAPSIANPVTTQAELDYELRKYHKDVLGRITGIQTQINSLAQNNGSTGGGGGGGGGTPTPILTPRVVAGGYVLGGSRYGPEAAILQCLMTEIAPNVTSIQDAIALYISRYGYDPNLSIPDLPAWDISKRITTGQRTSANTYTAYTSPGSYPTDMMDIYVRTDSQNTTVQQLNKKLYSSNVSFNGQKHSGTDEPKNEMFLFCKKTIRLDRALVNEWMGDYQVQVQLLNCAPVGKSIVNTELNEISYQGIFVDKEADRFTIYVAWPAPLPLNSYFAPNSSFGSERPPHEWGTIPGSNLLGGSNSSYSNMLRTNAQKVPANFVVMNRDIFNQSIEGYRATLNPGLSLYPSITFQVIGYPRNSQSLGLNLTTQNDLIVLS